MFKFHDVTGFGSRRAGVLSTTAAPIPVLMFALALTFALALILASTAAPAATPAPAPGNLDAARLLGADKEPQNWFTGGRDKDGSYYSPLAGIDAKNVTQLGFAWQYDL
ncbi:MAG TPA: hypothetical protein VGI51_10985, partial [Steroidobacteraceae bacterium]